MVMQAVVLVHRFHTRQHMEREGSPWFPPCIVPCATTFLPRGHLYLKNHTVLSAAPKLARFAASRAQGSPRHVLHTHGCRLAQQHCTQQRT